jgi:superfamily II DNA/RNA helicase
MENWEKYDIDKRIISSISKLEFKAPTTIQKKVIPSALEGRDIIARGKTGSGNTLAFLVPLIQRILQKEEDNTLIKGLIIVPSSELGINF